MSQIKEKNIGIVGATGIVGKELIFLFEIIRFLLQLAYYVAIVIIVIGIIDMTKTLPDVPPPSRGDPAVL